MKIETIVNKDGSTAVVSFQRLPHKPGHQARRTVGFICEADSIAEATKGTVEMMAHYCTLTGESPSLIIDRTEFL